ncbi:ABC transporter substrate-binding protein [Saccharicrinis aurantiacus]|uniref:ABC transporter substrate-binding protein n=1 Tax=Saccharicrinis aurantiacus TaxID=1849719 RepID=UPI000838F574|nr:sugar ABC transporter substrate-binding protein [Saccharicrinis aurantiacus]
MNSNKLRIAVRKYDPFESAIEKIWQKFKGTTACPLELEIVLLDLHPLYEEIIVKDGLKNGDWDITFINTDWITEAVKDGHVEKLDAYIKRSTPDSYPENWSSSLLQMQEFDGSVYGLPMHNGPECLIYRKDLFESAQEKEAFKVRYGRELEVPSTWDEFNELALFFQRPIEGQYGTVFAAYPDGHNTVFDFCLQMWTRGGELLAEDGAVILNSEQAIAGMKYYRSAIKNTEMVHPKSFDLDSVQSGMAFANGEVAMMVNWFGFASMCEVYDKSKVKGKVDVAYVPAGAGGEGVSLNAYWLYALGTGSKHKQIAYDFMRFAINAENDKLLTLEGGIGCRKSTWIDAEVNSVVPYYYKLEKLHKNTRALPKLAHWPKVASVIDKLVLEVINTEKDIEDILNEAQLKLDAM